LIRILLVSCNRLSKCSVTCINVCYWLPLKPGVVGLRFWDTPWFWCMPINSTSRIYLHCCELIYAMRTNYVSPDDDAHAIATTHVTAEGVHVLDVKFIGNVTDSLTELHFRRYLNQSGNGNNTDPSRILCRVLESRPHWTNTNQERT